MDRRYKSERFKETLAEYEDLLNNKDIDDLFGTDDFTDIAQYFYEQGEYDKSEEAIAKALEMYPGSIGPLAFKSRYALLKEKDVKRAEEIADEVEDKGDPDFVLLKAEIMIVDNRAQEADDYLEKAYQDFYGDDYYDDMPLDVAVLFADYVEMEYAEKWLNRSSEEDEDMYKDVKSRILMTQGKFDESEKILNELLDNDPYSANYWNQLAAEKMMTNDIPGSVTSSEFALAIDPDDRDAILNKGNGLLGLENFKEAEKFFRHYSKLEPDSDTGYIMTAMSLIAQNRTQEALKALKKALEVINGSPHKWASKAEVIVQLAFIEDQLGHYDVVHDYLNQAEAIFRENVTDPEQLVKYIIDIDITQGHAYLKEEKLDEAISWFERAVKESKSDPNTYVKIAISAYECGYVHYAYKILHRVIYEEKFESNLGYIYLEKCCKALDLDDERKWAKERIKE